MVKWDGTIPFDLNGNLVDYVSPYQQQNGIEWRANTEFEAMMVVDGFYHGRSSAGLMIQDILTKNRYPISLHDFYQLIPNLMAGQIRGKWSFAKKGKNFFIVCKGIL